MPVTSKKVNDAKILIADELRSGHARDVSLKTFYLGLYAALISLQDILYL